MTNRLLSKLNVWSRVSIPVQISCVEIHFSLIGYHSLNLAKKETIISSSSQVNFSSSYLITGGKYFFLMVSCMEQTNNPAFDVFDLFYLDTSFFDSPSSSSSSKPSSSSSVVLSAPSSFASSSKSSASSDSISSFEITD